MRRFIFVLLLLCSSWAEAQFTAGGTASWSGSATIGSPAVTGFVYVSPAGSDSNNCTLSAPCLTPQQATTMVKTRPVGQQTVVFRGGLYPLTTWTLAAGDSGTLANPIVYSAYSGETPIISGGRVVTGTWTQGAINCGGTCQEWDITLDANPADTGYYSKFESLFYNGERRYRPAVGVDADGWSTQGPIACVNAVSAACPVQGSCGTGKFQCHDRYAREAGDAATTFHGVTWSCSGSTMPYTCSGAHEVEILGMENWTGSLMRLTPSSNDGTNACTTSASTYCVTGITSAAPNFGPKTNGRYLRVNALEDLNQPGQFYLDVCPTDCSAGAQNSFVLRYLADVSRSENPNSAQIVVPQVNQILSANGVRYVNFSGLTFAHDNYVVPAAGLAATSHASNVTAAMSFIGSSNVSFDQSSWLHMGHWALEFKGTGASGVGNSVTNFVFGDLGTGGIRLQGIKSGGDTDSNVSQYNLIQNGWFKGGQRILPGGTGIAVGVGNSHHNTLANLTIKDWYNGGFEVGVADGSGTGFLTHDNLATKIVCDTIGQGVTSDMGCLHAASGFSSGNAISYSIAHDIVEDPRPQGYNGLGFYFDQGSSSWMASSLLAYRATRVAYMFNGLPSGSGTANTLTNSIAGSAGQGAIQRSATDSNLDLTVTHNLFYLDEANGKGGPQYANDLVTPGPQWYCQGVSCPNIFAFDYNQYFNPSMDLASSSQAPFYTTNSAGVATWANWASWKGLGEDTHSAVGDPGFVGPSFAQGDNYNFAGTVPSGFTAWDYATAGVQGIAEPADVPAAYPLSPAPLIRAVSPASGAAGDVVSVNGKFFVKGASVKFGATAASAVSYASSTQLQVTVPAGTGAADITVTNPGQYGYGSTLAAGFTYGSSVAALPQNWVNTHQCDTALNTPDVTVTLGANPTYADLNSALSAAEDRRVSSNQSTKIVVPATGAGTGTIIVSGDASRILMPNHGYTGTKCIVVESSNPLRAGVMAGHIAIKTIARASNVVTVQTYDAHGLANGDKVEIRRVTGWTTNFNGVQGTVTATDSTHFSFAQSGANESGTVTFPFTMMAGPNTLAQQSGANFYKINDTAVASSLMFSDYGAHHYAWFDGEFYTSAAGGLQQTMIFAGPYVPGVTDYTQQGQHMGFDRSYIHSCAGVVPTTIEIFPHPIPCSTEAGAKTGIRLYCSDCWLTNSMGDQMMLAGVDGHIVGTYSGSGPLKITNNMLRGAATTVHFGGTTPEIAGLIPSDIEIRQNIITKDPNWRQVSQTTGSCPSGIGTTGNKWGLKNGFELKNASRVLFAGNDLSETWCDGQDGTIVMMTSRACSGTCTGGNWSPVTDVTMEDNLIHEAYNFMTFQGRDIAPPGVGSGQSMPTEKFLVRNNMVWNMGKTGYGGGTVKGMSLLEGGETYSATATRAGNVATLSNLVCNASGNCPYSGMVTGDMLLVTACSDASFNNDTLNGPNKAHVTSSTWNTLGPITYANSGPDVSSGVTCTVSNQQGWPGFLTLNHNTVISQVPYNGWGTTVLSAQATTHNPNQIQFIDNINLITSGTTAGNGVYCGQSGHNYGSSSANAGACFGPGFTLHHNLYGLRSLRNSDSDWTNGIEGGHPDVMWYQTSNSCGACSGGNCPATCPGLKADFASGPAAVDYHDYALCHSTADCPASGKSYFAAGSAGQASDGEDLGVDLSEIDAAQVQGQYVCRTGCGTGPYGH